MQLLQRRIFALVAFALSLSSPMSFLCNFSPGADQFFRKRTKRSRENSFYAFSYEDFEKEEQGKYFESTTNLPFTFFCTLLFSGNIHYVLRKYDANLSWCRFETKVPSLSLIQ